MFDKKRKSIVRLALLTSVLIFGGCSKSFVVTSEVPQPLIERVPMKAKMDYSEEFKNYVYVEAGDDRALEKVDFGQAQVGMFDRVFNNLLTIVEAEDSDYEMKIQPQILDFQYSIPAETKVNMYEIWLKYRLRITDKNDTEIADWVVKGYGKTPTSMLSSQLKAFNTASNVALRDIGAQLAIGFVTQPSIEDYIATRKLPEPEPVTDEELESEGDAELDHTPLDDAAEVIETAAAKADDMTDDKAVLTDSAAENTDE